MQKILLSTIFSLITSLIYCQFTPYNHSSTTVTDTAGILYDGNGPIANYSPDIQSSPFTIKASNGKTITTQFHEFDVETNEAGLSQACIYDYLEIYDGDNADPLLLVGRYCGTALPPDFTSTGDAVTIVFTSDGGTERPGYKMYWSTGGGFPSTSSNYCDAAGYSCTIGSDEDDYIENVTVGDINNTSNCSPSGYSDHTDLSTSVTPGMAYPITADVGVGVDGIIYVLGGFKAWVDWNQDFAFDEATESVQLVGSTQGITFAGTLVVPIDAVSGITRLRVRYEVIDEIPACGTSGLGEVEDYTIIVEDPNLPQCTNVLAPIDSSSNNCTFPTFVWTTAENATSYEVQVFDSLGNKVIAESTTDTTLTPSTELNINSDYKVLISPTNDDNEQAILCDTIDFQTAASRDPQVSFSPSSISVCANQDLTVVPQIQFGVTPFTHSWNGSNNTFLNDTSFATPIFNSTASNAESYGYTVTSANNCSSTDTVTIEVQPSPTYDAINWGKTSLCPNETPNISISNTNGTIQFEEFNGSSWVAANNVTNSANQYSFDLSLGQTDIRFIIDLNGCTDTSAVETFELLTTPALPIIASTDNDLLWCENEVEMLYVDNYDNNLLWSNGSTTDTITPSNSGQLTVEYSYGDQCKVISTPVDIIISKLPSKPNISSTSGLSLCDGAPTTLTTDAVGVDFLWSTQETSGSINVSQPGQYYVDITNSAGCKIASDTLTITVNSKPAKPNIFSDMGTEICEGEATTLSTDASGSLLWSTSETSSTITIISTSTITVEVTDQNGCSNTSAPFVLTVNSAPAQPNISSDLGTEICEGEIATLSTDANGTLLWSTNESSSTISVTTTSSITVEVTDQNGCSNTSTPFTLTVNDLPNTPSIIEVGDSLFCSEEGANYSWFQNGTPYGPNARTIKADRGENYSVQITSNEGCSSEVSEEIFFETIGINERDKMNINVYPNPVIHAQLTLIVENPQTMLLMNNLGQTIQKIELQSGINTIEVKHPTGIYYIISANKQFVQKLIIE